jgi:membrane-bound lytic murein transglycosylase D
MNFGAGLPAQAGLSARQAGGKASALKPDDHPDLWARLRRGLSLSGRDHPRVFREIERSASEQDYLNKVTARARPFLYYVLQEVEKRGLPSEIALLPVVESAYSPHALSSKQAAGIWQIIPATAQELGLKQTFWYDGRRDIVASTKAALDYLERLNSDFGGDWLLTLAAYNGGVGMVQRAIARNREAGRSADFWSLDLPRETETYIPRLLAVASVVSAPELFGVNLNSIPNQRYLTQVKLASQINLDTAAKLAGMSRAELSRLNPGYVRDATGPQGPHHLLLPAHKVKVFNNKLAEQRTTAQLQVTAAPRLPAQTALPAQAGQRSQNFPAAPTGQRAYYTVRAGDNLTDIAARFRVSVNDLRAWNAALLKMLKGKPLQAGTTLTLYLQSTLVAQRKLPQ